MLELDRLPLEGDLLETLHLALKKNQTSTFNHLLEMPYLAQKE
jgi:hypothetical protein